MKSYIYQIASILVAFQSVNAQQSPLIATCSAGPTITASAGTVIGTATFLPGPEITVNKYLGIPYASTPPERFSPPQTATQLDQALCAQAYKAACFQQFRGSSVEEAKFLKEVFGGAPQDPDESEDCLYLNIFTPDTSTKTKPVMFWIFGGALTFGHAGQALYDGSSLAANQDVVVVTFNYRTNVFGFSNSPAISPEDHNAGFYDQRMALSWVQANIAAFGGDPTKVTIFGQSAGSRSADRLVLSPPSPIPFRAAILQSDVATYGKNLDHSYGSWYNLATALGCRDKTSSSDELACMRSQDGRAIRDAVQANGRFFTQWTDGITKITTPVDRSQYQTVPIMLGSTFTEGRVLEVGQHDYPTYVSKTCGQDDNLCYNLTTAYPCGSGCDTYSTISKIKTEGSYLCPAAYTTDASIAAGQKTWRYMFNASYSNTNFNSALSEYGHDGINLKAFHSSEIQYVFGNLPSGASIAQKQLSAVMQAMWANFTKDPSGYGPNPSWNQDNLVVFNSAGQAILVDGGGIAQIDERCKCWEGELMSGGDDD